MAGNPNGLEEITLPRITAQQPPQPATAPLPKRKAKSMWIPLTTAQDQQNLERNRASYDLVTKWATASTTVPPHPPTSQSRHTETLPDVLSAVEVSATAKTAHTPCPPKVPSTAATPTPPAGDEAARTADSSEKDAAALFEAKNFIGHLRSRHEPGGVVPGSLEPHGGSSNSLMNGFEVPDLVLSAGGLQSLSSRTDHREDVTAHLPTINLADLSLFHPSAEGGQAAHTTAAGADRAALEAAAVPPSTDSVEPTVASAPPPTPPPPPPLPATTRVKAGTRADGSRFLLTDSRNASSTAIFADAGEAHGPPGPGVRLDTVTATTENSDYIVAPLDDATLKEVDDELSIEPSGTSDSPTKSPRDRSILMPSSHHRSRSLESSSAAALDTVPFHNRIVMKQETDADLQCFMAHEYILAYYGARGYNTEDARSSSTQSSQTSRQSSRTRRAVVHAPDYKEDKKKKKKRRKRAMSEAARMSAFASADVEELYEHLAQAYRVGGIPKGYLDSLYMAEVQSGARAPRPHDARHGAEARRDRLSPVSGDDVPLVLMSATETVDPVRPSDVEALQELLQGTQAAKRDGGRRAKQRDKSEAAFTQLGRVGQESTKGRRDGDDVNSPAAGQGTQRVSAYEFMLKKLRSNAVRFQYQHNRMTLADFRFVKRSGVVRVGDKTIGLHLWDDAKTGFLVTGVFDHSVEYPKNFQDPVTQDLYEDELKGGVASTFLDPELIRQHSAINARCAGTDSAVVLRGCSFIRDGNVFGIHDGRVYGCQVPRPQRDHRRTGMHSAIQSLVHYMNLFREYPSLLRILHPQDLYRFPVVNPVGGMYCFPLIVNGAARLVKVDDYLPADPISGIFRCLTSSANELFPALLEKALMKVNGGGVNVFLMEPCNVVHQLCGWIPQTIPLTNTDGPARYSWFDPLFGCDMWDSLSEMYMRGRLVLSLVALWPTGAPQGSGLQRKPKFMNRPPNFVTPISFPVLDMISLVEQAPDGQSSRRICAVMLRDTTKDALEADFTPPVQTSLSAETLASLGYTATHRAAGVFCVTWEEAAMYFDHCSVSYNPSVFWCMSSAKLKAREPSRLCFHDVYDMRNHAQHLYRQPQYHLQCRDVEACTHVFLAFTPHASAQKPVGWPCNAFSTSAVDRSTGGYGTVRLRVFEVTNIPSLLQAKGMDGAASGGGSGLLPCKVDACVARRLTCETEGPRWMYPLATAVGYVSSTVTLAFDVAPGTRDFVVVVDVEADPRVAPQDALKNFAYTLTLFTNMAIGEEDNPAHRPTFGGGDTPAASVPPSSPSSAKPSPGVAAARQRLGTAVPKRWDGPRRPSVVMHRIPHHQRLNSRSVKATWTRQLDGAGTLAMHHDLITQQWGTAVQYHLRLTEPDDVVVRLMALRGNTKQAPAAYMRLVVLRRSESGPVVPFTSFSLSGNKTDMVLCNSGWCSNGAALDTASPHAIWQDRHMELAPDVQHLRHSYHNIVMLSLFLKPEDKVDTPRHFTVERPDPADRLQSLVIRAFADGRLISPAACRIAFMGETVSPDSTIRALFARQRACYHLFMSNNGVRRMGEAGEAEPQLPLTGVCPILDTYVDLSLHNTSPFTEEDFREEDGSALVLAQLREIAIDALKSAGTQRTRAWRALFHLGSRIQQLDLPEDKTYFLLGLTRSIADWIGHKASQRVDPAAEVLPVRMQKLPAGDYIIIPCFTANNKHVLKIESGDGKPPRVCRPKIHDEQSFVLTVELLRQKVDLTLIPSKRDHKARLPLPLSAMMSEYRAEAKPGLGNAPY